MSAGGVVGLSKLRHERKQIKLHPVIHDFFVLDLVDDDESSCDRFSGRLNVHLTCAHQFYTPVEADTGESQKALIRLVKRLENHPSEPSRTRSF